jgi:hypothetical protein
VELIVLGPAFQRNVAPSTAGPSSDADFTSGFQLGHRSIAVTQA